MSNSVDPDETAHMSRLIWIYAVCKAYYYPLWQWKSYEKYCKYCKERAQSSCEKKNVKNEKSENIVKTEK